MSAAYRIEPDVVGRCLRITVKGFWSLSDCSDYRRELNQAMDRMARETPRFVVLCDASAMPVQSREVSQAQSSLVKSLVSRNVRTAIVVDQVLNKLQADRMVGVTRGLRIFRDAGEAVDWLAHG